MFKRIILIGMLTSYALGTNYFVKNKGSDANLGSSPDYAWASLARVNKADLVPGDTVSFEAGGVWNEPVGIVPKTSGVPGSPIVYQSYGVGAKPILDGKGVNQWGVLIRNKNYIKVDGLDLRNNLDYGIVATGCIGCEFTNNSISNSGNRAISIAAGTGGIIIRGNTYRITIPQFNQLSGAIQCNSILLPGCYISDNLIDMTNLNVSKHGSGIVCVDAPCVQTRNTVIMSQAMQCFGLKAITQSMDGGKITLNNCTGLTNTCTDGCDGEAIELTGFSDTIMVTKPIVFGNYIMNGVSSSDSIGAFRARDGVIANNVFVGNPGQNAILHFSTNVIGFLISGNVGYSSSQGMTFMGDTVSGHVLRNNVLTGTLGRNYNFLNGASGTCKDNISLNNAGIAFEGCIDGGVDPRLIDAVK